MGHDVEQHEKPARLAPIWALAKMAGAAVALLIAFLGTIAFCIILIDTNPPRSTRWTLGAGGLLATAALAFVLVSAFGKQALDALRERLTAKKPRFTSATFERAADVVASYAEDTLANIRLVREGGPFAAVVITDRNRLVEALRLTDRKTARHCLLGGLLVAQKPPVYSPMGMGYMLDLQSDLLYAEIYLKGLRDGSENEARFRQGIPKLLDRILLRSRALELAFRHQAHIAAEDCLTLLIAQIGELPGYKMLEPRIEAVTRELLTALIQQYDLDLHRVMKAQAALLLEPTRFAERVRGIAYNPMPVWHDRADHEGAKTINDVWMPVEYAKPYLLNAARLQAESIVDGLAAKEETAAPN